MWRLTIWGYYFQTLENRHIRTWVPYRRETQGVSYMLASTFFLEILSEIQCREMEPKQDRKTHWVEESDIKVDASEVNAIFRAGGNWLKVVLHMYKGRLRNRETTSYKAMKDFRHQIPWLGRVWRPPWTPQTFRWDHRMIIF